MSRSRSNSHQLKCILLLVMTTTTSMMMIIIDHWLYCHCWGWPGGATTTTMMMMMRRRRSNSPRLMYRAVRPLLLPIPPQAAPTNGNKIFPRIKFLTDLDNFYKHGLFFANNCISDVSTNTCGTCVKHVGRADKDKNLDYELWIVCMCD